MRSKVIKPRKYIYFWIKNVRERDQLDIQFTGSRGVIKVLEFPQQND